MRAWTMGIDKNNNGFISFVEFCKVARDNGYIGNLKELWKNFDKDGEGFISMDEFIPEIAAMMKSFVQCLRDKHEGSLIKAWKQTIDPDKSMAATKEDLVAAMKKLEWDGNAGRVFDLLDYDHSPREAGGILHSAAAPHLKTPELRHRTSGNTSFFRDHSALCLGSLLAKLAEKLRKEGTLLFGWERLCLRTLRLPHGNGFNLRTAAELQGPQELMRCVVRSR